MLLKLIILNSCVLLCLCTNVRVVTWNVNDNSKMDDGFTTQAIDNVLDLKSGTKADIYAIGLQEQCWECNEKDFDKIGKKFLDRIHAASRGVTYQLIHVEGTRESRWCTWGCKFGTHGTTLVLVIARKGIVTRSFGFHRNDGCSDSTPENDEKGIAAIKVTLSNGKVACFASGHLESGDADVRRVCVKYFLQDANSKADWSKSCNYKFIFGDFNTRTGPKTKGSDTGRYISASDVSLKQLFSKDELVGTKPYGTSNKWSRNMLAYINQLQPSSPDYKEAPVNFAPSYSIRPSSECSGRKTCYRKNRPVSWTDRIIYSGNGIKCSKYQSIVEVYGDHFPVVGDYQLV